MIERLAVAGTGGLLHRGPAGIMLIDAVAVKPSGAQLYDEWWAMSAPERRDTWRAASQAGELPTMAVITKIDDDWVVMLSGRVSMVTRTRFGSVTARPEATGIHEQRLHRDLVELRIALEDDVAEDSPLDEVVDVQAGAVRAARFTAIFDMAESSTDEGLTLDPPAANSLDVPVGDGVQVDPAPPLDIPRAPVVAAAGAAAVVGGAAAELAADDVPDVAADFESFDLAEAPAAAEPLPVSDDATPDADASGENEPAGAIQVMGVRCPAGHHNHPDAGYCSQCGRKMGVNLTTVLVLGDRPPLGLLIVDDGTTIPLTDDIVVGRDPRSHETVSEGGATPILVPDDSLGLSRAHATFTLQDWDVVVTDLGSSNGTFVRHENTQEWLPLVPYQVTALVAGDTVRLAGREMLLELHHVR